MPLDRVTITGADDGIDPSALVGLSLEFPFVEWGILVSYSKRNQPRYPSLSWFQLFQEVAIGRFDLNCSLHVCGDWVKNLVAGYDYLPIGFARGFKRAQLNMNFLQDVTFSTQFNTRSFMSSLKRYPIEQWIFQISGTSSFGACCLRDIQTSCPDDAYDIVTFFDASGGKGKLPDAWPDPIFEDLTHSEHGHYAYCGYAGGLDEYNLAAQLQKIEDVAQNHGDMHYWIDIESGARNVSNNTFDTSRVRRLLQICKEFMEH